MQQINETKQRPKRAFLRKVYAGHGLSVGIPKRIVKDFNLNSEDYLHLYYDQQNKQVVLRKVPTLEEI